MPLGLYIQIPFCQTKCTYCNFHTGVFSRSLYDPYVSAVCHEISHHSSLLPAAGINLLPLNFPPPEGRGFTPAVVGTQGNRASAPEASLSSGHGFSRAVTHAEGTGASAPEVGLPSNIEPPLVDSLYLGGGTPSLLDPAALARILSAARSAFAFTPDAEITLEADPETISPEKASAWLAAGINRISLGSQSFHDLELKSAGRLHRRDDIFRANEILRAAGFSNLSFDLIAGLPHQTLDSFAASLAALLSLRPEHISLYMMEIDEGSRLGREVLAAGPRYSAPALPDDETMAAAYDLARLQLHPAFDHYEISNWAAAPETLVRTASNCGTVHHPSSTPPLDVFSSRASALSAYRTSSRQSPEAHPAKSLRSRHNLKYWTRTPYLGFGAGAHSFNSRERWANAHDPAAYTAAIESARLPIEQHEILTPAQSLDEELFLGLRLLHGISIPALESRYQSSIAPRLAPLVANGLLEFDGSTARLSPSRLSISNEAFVELLGSTV